MQSSPVVRRLIRKITAESVTEKTDMLAVEEPLEIRLVYGNKNKRVQKSISVTMRTPGNDAELARGFLFTEGILSSAQDIIAIRHEAGQRENILRVELTEDLAVDIDKLERHFYTSSSCGVCGKSSIEAVRTVFTSPAAEDEPAAVSAGLLYSLPALLRRRQAVFEDTGGLHASALFTLEGELLLVREDVGRHNALDKLIGAALSGNPDSQGVPDSQGNPDSHGIPVGPGIPPRLPLNRHILLLSGRASFELIQKAAMAGIKIVAAVGAPSSLAVEMAEDHGMLLAGFLRSDRFNIYSGAHKLRIDEGCLL